MVGSEPVEGSPVAGGPADQGRGTYSAPSSRSSVAGSPGASNGPDAEDRGTAESHSEAPVESRKASKTVRKAVVWFIGIVVTTAVTAIVGQITNGWFTSGPAQPALTQVRLMQPFNATGKLLPPYKQSATSSGGSCISSYESSDPGALRCFSGSGVADPCWQGVNRVACLSAPWSTKALVIVNPQVNATPKASIGPIPWALEITDPANTGQILQCGFAGGTSAITVAGMRANWDCFRKGQYNPRGFVGYALGAPQPATAKPWTVYYAGTNSSQAVTAKVLTVWR